MPLNDKLLLQAVRVLPRHGVTRLLGTAASWQLPVAAREPVYRTFANAFGADVDEAEYDLKAYPSFNEFFSRRLRLGLRPWMAAGDEVAMPADGRLDQFGRASEGRLIQAKGIDYRAEALLGVAEDLAWTRDAWFATIYLSPADYHRVHVPCDASFHEIRRTGGELWPVNNISVPNVDGLFVVNERVAAQFQFRDGRRGALVMVAATIVGGIELAAALPSVAGAGAVWQAGAAEPRIRLDAGAEFGRFLLGSTAVLLIEDPKGEFTPAPDAVAGASVRLGQPLLLRSAPVTEPTTPRRRRGRG
jgi:phosphatidylserine decarboxylase